MGNLFLCSFYFEKSLKNDLFFRTLPKTYFFSTDTYFDYGVLPIAEGVEFLPFFGLGHWKNNDILGIYFVRNNFIFSDAPELVQNKIPKKKNTFLGIFFGGIFYHVSFAWLDFLYCAFWVVNDVRLFGRVEKLPEKITFFTWNNTVFFLAPALLLRKCIPYFSANSLEPRIRRDQHIQICQFKTTNVKIHPAVPKVYTHLISFD